MDSVQSVTYRVARGHTLFIAQRGADAAAGTTIDLSHLSPIDRKILVGRGVVEEVEEQDDAN